MHCDIKKFRNSDENKSTICLVEISASVHGTTMTLNFPKNKKEDIVASLSKASIPLKSSGLTSISIRTSLHDTANIKKSLEILSFDGLISQDFAHEIATNYPNGHGGNMDLNNPVKGINALLILAKSDIFNSNAQPGKESRKNKQEDTYCGFKPGFL